MPYEIRRWEEIAGDFERGTVLVGNGASIAIDRGFAYEALLQEARRRGLLTAQVEDLFRSFTTNDFELALRLVWHATKVNSALQIPDDLTRQVYQDIRQALIETVRAVHPAHADVATRLPSMYRFLKRFSTVLSLNYDLLVYWTMTYGLDVPDRHQFKDCFLDGSFDDDWKRFRGRIWEQTNTLVFYPHGNLALRRDVVDREGKIHDQGAGLLGAILHAWNTGSYIPLFVSEGTSAQKLSAIQNSYYLSTVYREVIPSLEGALTIFGWGMGEHDAHLLQRLAHANVARVACSVYQGNQQFCETASRTIRDRLGEIDVVFFDSASAGWAVGA
ncbi:MAG TPA: DUF4917 family protein [Pseudomonas aeruginosa]|uniref:DUF4917 family protein n=1 Tax=Pseudomonadaceae TaxID=135621 RepID=UPI000EB378A1|nr:MULTISPECIES: DUF4917 family protein [Pseudomonadaceae]QTF57951.1 DUF4917 family protein [Stutzerimonas frequens]HCT6673939.1 DUF4917 family protein [Pseudomonas aeruginosa]HHV91580.1 DUF4917 family protein [Pseudomonas aeruginosa]